MAIDDSSKGSWLGDNIAQPAVDSLKESANTGINLLNCLLSPSGKQIEKFHVSEAERSMVGQAIFGLTSVVPYALAGGVVGRAARLLPASEGAAGAFFHNSSVHQIAGAAAYDGIRDVRAGETRQGNIAGSIAGFSVFELGNARFKGMNFGSTIGSRIGVGVMGGGAQSLASDLASFQAPQFGHVADAATAGGAMNLLLPSAQYAVSSMFRLRPQHGAAPAVEIAPAAKAEPPIKAESELKVEPPIKTEPVTLEEFPAWNMLRRHSEGLKTHERAFQAGMEVEHIMPAVARNKIAKADAAQANIKALMDGKISEQTQAYIDKGWLPADSLRLVQEKLRADLKAADVVDPQVANVHSMQHFRHSQLEPAQYRAIEKLIGEYEGSSTRSVLKAIGADSHTLGDAYDFRASYDAQALSTPQMVGWKPVSSHAVDIQHTVDGMERALANPATRETTLRELDAARMDSANTFDKYAMLNRGHVREPGAVDLSKFPTFQEVYRMLAIQEREQQTAANVSQHEASVWTRQALRNMEEIATGNFDPSVQARFAERPEVLNGLRASLESDLSHNYRDQSKPFSKETPQTLHYTYQELLKGYARSPMYNLLRYQDQVPPQLERMYSHVRFMDPVSKAGTIERGLNAIYAIERGLLNPETAAQIRTDLAGKRLGIHENQVLDSYSELYERLYAEQPRPTDTADYSSVVQFKPRGT